MSIDPDCKVGKHRACPGWTWDDDADTTVDCGCDCHVPVDELVDRIATAKTVVDRFNHNDPLTSLADLHDALKGD